MEAKLYSIVDTQTQKEPILPYTYIVVSKVDPVGALLQAMDDKVMSNADVKGALDRGIPLWYNHLAKTDPAAKAARLEAERKAAPGKAWDDLMRGLLTVGQTREQILAIIHERPADLV
jgi:hypothetical protein